MSINELCHYLLFLGLFVAFTHDKKKPPAFGASLYFLCTLLSFLGLLFCHTSSNFSNYNAFTNSNANAPSLYQISGTWSNHEGSILLWCWILSFYGFLFCYHGNNVSERGGRRDTAFCFFALSFVKNLILYSSCYKQCSIKPIALQLKRDAKDRVLPIDEHQIYSVGIALFFSLFLLASSNPFIRNSFVCTESLAELNPVLQDPILAIHPPCIYAGEVASAMGFGLCRSKMINWIVALYSPIKKDWTGALMDTGRDRKKRFVRNERKDTTTFLLCPAGVNTVVSDPKKDREQLRIWIQTCWWFLTVGILLGSWWAYHELGWGGWWFWDPVENASFMPWVLATACIHSIIRPKVSFWTFFLNIVTFLCCVLGTFLVRSGLLASVHSFATDSARGIFLWRFFLLITGISLILLFQMKRRTLIHRTQQKIVVARSSILHLRNSAFH